MASVALSVGNDLCAIYKRMKIRKGNYGIAVTSNLHSSVSKAVLKHPANVGKIQT